jgi:hypothetical protein
MKQVWAACAVKGEGNVPIRAGSETEATGVSTKQMERTHFIETFAFLSHEKVKRGKAIPITGCGDSQGCEMSRLLHFIDSRLTDCGEVLSLTRRSAALYPQEDF